MQLTHFSQLQANLSEIYAALRAQPHASDLPLYAPSSSQVYFQGCWMGQTWKMWDQTWRWIHSSSPAPSSEQTLSRILNTLFDRAVRCAYEVRQRRIWHNMRQIDQVWKDHMQSHDFEEQRERYTSFLAEELEESTSENPSRYLNKFNARGAQPLNAQELQVLRQTMVNFHQATYPFWSLFVHETEKHGIQRTSLMHLIKSTATLIDHPLFKALKKEKRWIELEGIMQQPIPVALFAKLEDPTSLTVVEKRLLKRWVQTLNDCQQVISLKLFSYVLHDIMSVIQLQGSSTLTLPDLLDWLDRQGCQLIHQEDPAHMDWRESLAEGDTLTCNGKPLVLGEQLSPDKPMNDRFKVFALRDYPQCVVKIAHNRLLLLMEDSKSRNEHEHWGIRLVEAIDNIAEDDEAEVSGLDRQGYCIVLEKLFNPLSQHVWTSQGWELIQEDEEVALVFANHLFCMAQWKATAQDLSLSHLMWDEQGVLKSTRLLKKGAANYNEWETYCVTVANGNLYVLSFLMHVSQLSEHPIAAYYRDAIEHVLETGETDLIGRSLPLGHRQNNYQQHVKSLCAQAQELRQNCLQKIIAQMRKKREYSHKREKDLQAAISKKLLQFYQLSPTPGRFEADLEQKTIASFTKGSSKNVSLLDPLDAEEYYQEKYEQMMEYNEACLDI